MNALKIRIHTPLRMGDNANGGMCWERYIREKHRSGVWKMRWQDNHSLEACFVGAKEELKSGGPKQA